MTSLANSSSFQVLERAKGILPRLRLAVAKDFACMIYVDVVQGCQGTMAELHY